MSFFHLCQSNDTLKQCQHYFRIYPFRNSHVMREDHARNICEFYLGNIYILRSRLKTFLNSLTIVCPDCHVNIAGTLRSFDKVFRQELRMRNGVTHHEPFQEFSTQRLFLTRIMSESPGLKDKGFEREHLREYRKFASAWSQRAISHSHTVTLLVDAFAKVLLEKATFLNV
jgi:hypothetical protein